MESRKRGNYFGYLRTNIKIPRQTAWNRSKKVDSVILCLSLETKYLFTVFAFIFIFSKFTSGSSTSNAHNYEAGSSNRCFNEQFRVTQREDFDYNFNGHDTNETIYSSHGNENSLFGHSNVYPNTSNADFNAGNEIYTSNQNTQTNMDDGNANTNNIDFMTLMNTENENNYDRLNELRYASFEELNTNDDFDQTDEPNFDFYGFSRVHENIDCTKKDALHMIYAYFVRHNLSWTALEDLCRLINNIIGTDCIPSSKYIFKKIFLKNQPKPVYHFWCSNCNKYFGTNETNSPNEKICQNCEKIVSTETKYGKNHFVHIPLEQHLTRILQRNAEILNLSGTATQDSASDNVIRDVYDSDNFKLLRSNMKNDLFVTLTINTDGAVVFKSTKKKSFWPIQFYINEVPIEKRFKRENMICSAFSFGETPDMVIFLKPTIEEINHINESGGISVKIGGRFKHLKVITMIVTADTIAKTYLLQNTQFNGRFGCPYCLHPGTSVEGRKQLYYSNKDAAEIRTNEESRKAMLEAFATSTRVLGYRGVSPFIGLNSHFDVVWQVAIDKMHSVDLGVTKKLFNLFLDKKYSKEAYVHIDYYYSTILKVNIHSIFLLCRFYIGNRMEQLDAKMKQIKLPRIITRNPRSFKDREYFHSYEWKYILLFTAIPTLTGILDSKFVFYIYFEYVKSLFL